MDVTINERSPVDFELDIRATHEELEPRLDAALREQRKKMNLKGFRPGKVPLSLVKKMYGSAIAAQLAEEIIGEAYRDEVAESDERDVIGQPRLTELDYDLGEDLHAVVRFGVKPAFEIADLSDAEVTRVRRAVSEEDVEEEIGRRRRRAATLVPAEADEPVREDSVVTVDLQRVDKETNTPIIGERQEGQEVDLTDERLRAELREALLGKAAGAEFTVDLPHQHGPDEGQDHDDHVDRFRVTLQDVKHRELPDLDVDFVKEESGGQSETVEAYREQVEKEITEAWRRMSSEMMREEMVRALLARHGFAVPEALTEQALDEMEEEAARRAGGELPEGFDRAGFREANRESAQEQVRWMLLKERVLEDADVEITEEDYDREFERMAESGPFDAAAVRSFVAQQPQLIRGIQQRMLNDRLFDALEARFKVVEKTPEEIEAEGEKEEA